jgi:hypothetical protein
MWEGIDGWGWKAGCDFPRGPSDPRAILLKQARAAFDDLFAHFQLDPNKDRAFRDTILRAQARGVRVSLIVMPESSEFRSWYPPVVEKAAQEHLTRLKDELGLPLIDARTWMEDDFFSDGFHLTRIGAAEFTRKLGPAATTLVRMQ